MKWILGLYHKWRRWKNVRKWTMIEGAPEGYWDNAAFKKANECEYVQHPSVTPEFKKCLMHSFGPKLPGLPVICTKCGFIAGGKND